MIFKIKMHLFDLWPRCDLELSDVASTLTQFALSQRTFLAWMPSINKKCHQNEFLSIVQIMPGWLSWNIDMHCELDVCIQFGWTAIILIIKYWENPGKKTRDWVDIVHGFSGHCPWSQWTLSMDWVDIVHGPRSNIAAGQCPLSPWTFYRREGFIILIICCKFWKNPFELKILDTFLASLYEVQGELLLSPRSSASASPSHCDKVYIQVLQKFISQNKCRWLWPMFYVPVIQVLLDCLMYEHHTSGLWVIMTWHLTSK